MQHRLYYQSSWGFGTEFQWEPVTRDPEVPAFADELPSFGSRASISKKLPHAQAAYPVICRRSQRKNRGSCLHALGFELRVSWTILRALLIYESLYVGPSRGRRFVKPSSVQGLPLPRRGAPRPGATGQASPEPPRSRCR